MKTSFQDNFLYFAVIVMLPSFKGVITPDLLIVAMDLLLLRKVTEARDAFAGLREIFQRYLFGYLISVAEAASFTGNCFDGNFRCYFYFNRFLQ